MKKTWIYTGLFLDEESKNRLLKAFDEYIPDGWTTYAHHVTMSFNNDVSKQDEVFNDFKEKFLGKNSAATVVSVGTSDRAVAVMVGNILTDNKRAHITLAIAPGARPVESNDIVDWEPLFNPIFVTGTFGYFANGQINFN